MQEIERVSDGKTSYNYIKEDVKMIWNELREEEFASAIEKSNKVCVIPIGCTEMHGQHLPVGTDTFEVTYVCREAAKREQVVVFPTIEFGNIPYLTDKKGSIRIRVETMQLLLTEICAEVARNGFKKVLIVNGHGGNLALLGNFVSSTQHDKKDYVVMYRCSYLYGVRELAEDIRKGEKFPILTKDDIKYLLAFNDAKKPTGHAGLDETATIMAVRPETVRLDRMRTVSGLPVGKNAYFTGTGICNNSCRFWHDEYPNHYAAHHCDDGVNERLGHVFLEKRIQAQAEACRILKMDDRVLEWNNEWNQSW